MTYTADGEKLTKAVTGGGATKNYVAGIEYGGANLEAIYHAEGRCTPNGATDVYYEYTVKDHLGNARVNYRASGTTIVNVEDHHYYPFGMKMEGLGSATIVNKYTYNGKEINEDFGLNLSDYGARWYDGPSNKWWAGDPAAEAFMNWSPYNYVFNNPLLYIDPDGATSVRNDIEYSYIYEEAQEAVSQLQRDAAMANPHNYADPRLPNLGMAANNANIPMMSSAGMKGDTCCPGWTSYIPVYGSFKDAMADWDNGKYGWALFNGAMGVSDVFLVKSIAINGGKLLLKGGLKTTGSHSWEATTRHWRKNGIDELSGGSKHHWGISQETMKEYPWLKPYGNQFPNIVKFEKHSDHIRFGHGQSYKGQRPGTIFERFWFGTPTWFKTTGSYGINSLENTYRPH